MAHGRCAGCGVLLSFNPERVPSIRIDGAREPLCRSCHSEWNRIHRTSKGLDPVPIDPMAYEPEPEEEGGE